MERDWQQVNSQNEIDQLLKIYGNFHDACLKELNYSSGVSVDKKGTMHYSASDGAIVNITFQSQWKPIEIELRFTGLRRMNLIGYQENYSAEIMDCYLAFHNHLIVWADNEGFDVRYTDTGGLLNEPMTSFIVAEKLEWRITDG